MRRSEIMDALTFIPADNRDTWVRIAMAIKSELDESGFGIWDNWSSTAGNYSKIAAMYVWRSIKSGPVGIGTLFHIARGCGYRPNKQVLPRPVPQRKAPPAPNSDTGAYAAKIWLQADRSDGAVAGHKYAINKDITHAGGSGRAIVSTRVVGQNVDCLVVPVRDLATGKLTGVQFIDTKGKKQSLGKVSGNGLLLGNTLDLNLDWFVVEGWASAYSMVFHHGSGNGCCAAAFGKGNMEKVAEVIEKIYQPKKLVITQEFDS